MKSTNTMNDLQTYENILVSGVDYDFSKNSHENIPPRLFADWAKLVCKIAKAVHPAFNIPPFPEFFEFKTESITSDGPYPASEDFYYLDYVYFNLVGDKGYGININFENFRQYGKDPVCMETIGFNYGVSSYISKESTSPLAQVNVWHDKDKTAEIEEIFNRHREYCLSKISY